MTRAEQIAELEGVAWELRDTIGFWTPGCTAYTPPWLTEAYRAWQALEQALELLRTQVDERHP